MSTRRRLTPEQRRDQLLDVGEQLFRTRTFEETSMDDVAEAAGVTRALLYHYFSTKAEFFGAIWGRAHTRLQLFAPAPTLRDSLREALAKYLDFYAENLPLVVIANRSSISHDPAVRTPIRQNFEAIRAVILDAARCAGPERAIAETAFTGWIAFVKETTVASLLDRQISHAENLDLCLAALDGTVGAHADLSRAPDH